MAKWNDHAYFDLGIRIEIDDRTTYHGQGWHTENGRIQCCIGPETSYVLTPTGECKVYHDGAKAW